MQAKIIKIGNSKGIRIPKLILGQSGIKDHVILTVSPGEIKIVPANSPSDKKIIANEEALLSEASLSDWLRPEEDAAWKDL